MDTSLIYEKYLDLPRGAAFNSYRDDKNIVSLRKFLSIFVIISAIISIVLLADKGFSISFILYSVLFLITLLLRYFYKKIFKVFNIQKSLFIFFVSGLLLYTSVKIVTQFDNTGEGKKSEKTIITDKKQNELKLEMDDKKGFDSGSLIFFFALSVIFFRFSRNEIVQLYTLIYGIPVLAELILFNDFSVGNKVASLIMVILFFIIAYTTESKRKKKFYAQFDYYGKRTHESRRMKRELDYAREIQLSMLPSNTAKFGDIDISAVSIPTYEVGGDYFDYFKISDNLVGVFICDVSGHGVASALLLSGLRSCMHLILEDTNNPKEVFSKLNRMIRKTQSRKMFVTAVFAVIDTENNTCSMFNAGHLPPYKISGDSNELFKIKRHGITLGAVTDISQDMGDTEVVFDFNKNDKIVFYTDGVTEAMNSFRNEYGFDKLEILLNANADKSPSELLKSLIDDVNNFTRDTEQKDDLSVLIIGRS